MIENFTLSTFSGRVGEPFRLVLDDGSILELELVEATVGPGAPPAGREPFSIVFRGPPDAALPQRIYPFEHEELGAFELFVVPIGRGEHGMQYEAVFT